mgnify:CR=1 FL=1
MTLWMSGMNLITLWTGTHPKKASDSQGAEDRDQSDCIGRQTYVTFGIIDRNEDRGLADDETDATIVRAIRRGRAFLVELVEDALVADNKVGKGRVVGKLAARDVVNVKSFDGCPECREKV